MNFDNRKDIINQITKNALESINKIISPIIDQYGLEIENEPNFFDRLGFMIEHNKDFNSRCRDISLVSS